MNTDHELEKSPANGWRENLKSRNGFRWSCWDFMIGLIACVAGFYLSPSNSDAMSLHFFLSCVVPFALLLSFFSKLCGVPPPCQSAGMGRYDLCVSAGIAVTISFIVILLFIYIKSATPCGRYIMGFMTLLAFAGMVVPRLLVASMVEIVPSRVMVLNAGPLGQEFCRRLVDAANFEVIGILDCQPENQDKMICNCPIVGSLKTMDYEDLNKFSPDMVVVCSSGEIQPECVTKLLNLPLHGIEVLTKAAFIETYFQEVSVRYANLNSFAAKSSLPGNTSIFIAKRMMDILGAIIGLVLTLAAWPFIALAIKLDSPGPILLKQVRVGHMGKNFEILKFRTMRQDAEKDGAQWAVEGDSRITRIGKFLRVSRLDEIPQLWNVLRGDMSLVGPRPERPEFVSNLVHEVPFYERRHLVPPGLTGWAQIRYKYGASNEDALRKLQFDLYYIRHLSLGLDLQIMIKTIPMMMKGSR